MSEPFIAEIRIFGFNFAPRGWSTCSGQILPISQNTALFSLLGTTYGGNGQTTFGLPDMRDRGPLGAGQGPGLSDRDLGEIGGAANATLSIAQMPAHNHPAACSSANGNSLSGRNKVWALNAGPSNMDAAVAGAQMAAGAIGPAGGSQPHNNLQPYLTLNFCIALQGIYPPRS